MPPAAAAATEERVLEIVRELALELGGRRAGLAVAPDASLEREVGLGSLERVELLVRLEAAFGRNLGERFLTLDTPAAVAQAIAEAAPLEAERLVATAPRLAEASRVDAAATIHETLWRRALADPERPQSYVREDDGQEQTISYGRLLRDARALAGGLRDAGVRKGDTVALMLPTGYDFLRSFQGILIAGAVPVPIYPPARLDRLDEYARRQSAILADAGVRILITIRKAMPIATLLRGSVASLTRATTAEDLIGVGATWEHPEGSGDDPAFIQYTSGSTGHPKGVLLTHANLMANIRAIGAGLEARPTDVGVSWLPLYHDMGLIGSWLFCMAGGLPIALLSPLAFLSRPERWLWTFHERRGSLSAAPNFAYELCARRIADAAIEGLDLSSWRCALNGAEPVNPETLERFAKRFAPYGFRRESFMPVYGLAENSVGLCFPPVGRGPRIDRVARAPFTDAHRALAAPEDETAPLRFVSVGTALPEHEVRILDEVGAVVAERTVGRLVFRGPSMTAGYFKNPEATAAMTAPDGFLDSGDLAYVVEGEVYVTGRRKDLIIKAGRNLVPQEIEEIASSVEGIRKGCVVAFGAPSETLGTESLVVVAETRREDAAGRDALATLVTERVADAVGAPPDAVVLVAPGAVPKTSSGKIRRQETRQRYLEGRLGRERGTTWGQRLTLLGGAAREAVTKPVRALRRGLYAAWLLLVLGIMTVVTWPIALLLPGRAPAMAIERWFCRIGLFLAGCRLSASGLENVAARGPVLIASNHASYLDVAVLLALVPRNFVFLAKKEILGWPFVGLFIRRAQHLTVDRFDAQEGVAGTGRVAAAVEAGEAVLVFPEGTFTAADGLRPFRLGLFKVALETGTPIVPVALTGTRRALRDGQTLPRPERIHLWVGAPVVPAGEGFKAIVALRDEVARAIAEHCGEPRLDLVAAGPERPTEA